MGYDSLSLATENTNICFVPLSLTARNISILPSLSLHQKYVGFIFLRFVGLQGMGYVSLNFRLKKTRLKYFDPLLCQFTPKICRFRFPRPC